MTSRTSIYYNVILAVARTINIIQPFYLIRKKWVILFAVFYPLLWTCISLVDLITMLSIGAGTVYVIFYHPLAGMCMIHSGCYMLTLILLLGIPFAIPVIIMMICGAIQCYSLINQHTVIINAGNVSREIKRTVTILLITVVCIICNMAYLVFWCLTWYTFDVGNTRFIVLYTLSTTLPFINSSINPLILITRGNAIKQYVIRSVCYIKERLMVIHCHLKG